MNSLDEYFRGQYRKDQEEVNIIDDIIDTVLQTLKDSAGNKYFVNLAGIKYGWSYEIKERDKPQENYSLSTNAMILFALKEYQTCGGRKDSVDFLLKAIKQLLEWESPDPDGVVGEKSADKFTIWPETLITNSHSSQLTTSETYGENDPLSLFWMTSLANFYLKEKPKETAGSLFIENVIKYISQSLLDPESKQEQKNNQNQAIELHDNAFVYLIILRFFAEIESNVQGSTVQSGTLKRLILQNRQNIHNVLEAKLHRHLSYCNIPDSRFDPAELTFCLEGMLLSKGHKISDGIVQRVFDVLLNTQEQTSVFWRPTTPIYAKKTGHILLPVSIEVANSLLRTCIILDSKTQTLDHFIKCVPLYQRYIQWLKAQQCSVSITIAGKENEFTGWASEHTASENCIHTWQTSQILLFLSSYIKQFDKYIAHTTLTKSGLIRHTPDDKIDSELAETKDPIGGNWSENISRKINDNFLKSRTKNSTTDPKWSFLLYGPPGTGKTRIAKVIAKALEWKYLIITPSDFLAGGAAEVEQRAKAMFSMLNEQEELVVLFDEIDHLLLDRESEEYNNLTGIFQFITPGMLPKLHDLRDKEKIIFIIATNYAERIDSAIKREGRIDMPLLLLPPDQNGRERLIRERLKVGIEPLGKEDTKLLAIAVDNSRLMTWTEIDSICKKVKKAIKDETKKKHRLEKFSALITEQTLNASISTDAYYNRFFDGKKGAESDKKLKAFRKAPWAEFVSLFCIEKGIENNLETQKFNAFLNDKSNYDKCFSTRGSTSNKYATLDQLKSKLETALKKCKVR